MTVHSDRRVITVLTVATLIGEEANLLRCATIAHSVQKEMSV